MRPAKLFLFGLLFLPLLSWADCPLGAKESHLTFTRVMRNFGRFTLSADSIALNGSNPWSQGTFPEADLQKAAGHLQIAIDCAELVLKDPRGELLPSKVSFMTDEKQKMEFVDDFVYFLTDFRDGLLEYLEIFKKLQTQNPPDRTFEEANEKRLELNKLIDRAHKKL